jgi:hypothetical protein
MNTSGFTIFRPIAIATFLSALVPFAQAQQASLKIEHEQPTIIQTNTPKWTLEKKFLSSVLPTLSWAAIATRGPLSQSQLTVYGYLYIRNTGSEPAPIGNIVVNLQRRIDHKWVTYVSDIADATKGNAAYFANISPSGSSEKRDFFTEGKVSGNLYFTDVDTAQPFDLVPQQAIAPEGSVRLVFTAQFNNALAAIPEGEPIRIETIVSFGNAGQRGGSGASVTNVDINGNGVIDANEAYVRSVVVRSGMEVPAVVTANNEVMLTDNRVVTTGTVETSNFNNHDIGTGVLISSDFKSKVSVDAFGGREGGTVTNTAYLDGEDLTVSVRLGSANDTVQFTIVPGIELSASSTVKVPKN